VKPVEQRDFNDCWNACMASIFELPYEDVADLPRGDVPGWFLGWSD
jgi:hypothetical protein